VRALLEPASLQVTTRMALKVELVDVPPAAPQAVVRAHLDLSGVTWKKEKGRQQAMLEILGGVYDASGRPLGLPFSKRLSFNLTPEEWRMAKAEGIPYTQPLALAAGRYQVRVIARDGKGKAVGGASEWIDVPEAKPRKLALSEIVLSAAPTADPAAFRASRTSSFPRGGSLYFQVYVHNPAVTESGKSQATLHTQLRSGKDVIAMFEPQPGSPARDERHPSRRTGIGPLSAPHRRDRSPRQHRAAEHRLPGGVTRLK
jgi:hypothetical protein